MPRNVLLVITDQQRADHVGFGGDALLRTPHLDSLAARGTVFDRCYVANPICMPNRCSILTGRLPSAHGVVFNDRSLAWTSNTFVRQLRAAGYRTGLVGKSHIQHGTSRNSRAEAERPPALADPYHPGWDSLEDEERWLDGEVLLPDDFYGFSEVEFALGHGDVVAGHHLRWAIERGADPADLATGFDELGTRVREGYDGWWQIYQPTLPAELHSTSFVTERSIDFIESASREGGPWFLQCSYPDPHHPFTPPGDWWRAYEPDAMSVSDSFDDPLTDAPKHLQVIRKLRPRRNWVQMFGPTREQLRHARAAEYGALEMIDDGVGRVLAALERCGAAEDTVVIFTSDHGDVFGDHGLMLKGMIHYQGCLRVPLVVARPGQTPARTPALASSLDLAQTVLELCDLAEYDGMQGASLVPVLDDPDATVRDHVLVEDDFPIARTAPIFPERARTLIADEGRLTRYSTGETEVFDLAGDPAELRNLAAATEGTEQTAQLTDRLVTALIEGADMARVDPLPAA